MTGFYYECREPLWGAMPVGGGAKDPDLAYLNVRAAAAALGMSLADGCEAAETERRRLRKAGPVSRAAPKGDGAYTAISRADR